MATGVIEHISRDGKKMTAGKQVTFLTDRDGNVDDRGAGYVNGLRSPSKVLQPEHEG